jgi:sugar phosphate isomerase/epimerase
MARRAESTLALSSALTARERLLSAPAGRTMDPEAQLEALLDAARALREARVAFALIGGLAVGMRTGVPRATIDIDLAVVSSASAAEVTRILAGAGFDRTGVFPHSLNFRHRGGEPLQAAFDPEFDRMIEFADPVDVRGVTLPIVRTEDLIAMKERAARDPARRRSKALRDLADIELLRGDVPEEDEGW